MKIRQFQREIEAELAELLTWWQDHMIDAKKGGFRGRIDGWGRAIPDADKAVILNTRILWTFSAAASDTGEERYRKTAERSWAYLVDHFIDDVHGGVFWLLDANGRVIQSKKQVYAQAFAIYAFVEYHLLTGNPQALLFAQDIFSLIERYSFDPVHGGYLEAFDRAWQPLDDQRLSDKDANEAKTMNTHLHLLEAYTNLYRVGQQPEVKEKLMALIHLFLEKFIDPTSGHLHLFFDEQWQLKSDIISYGHDIECSWLLVEAAALLSDRDLRDRVHQVARQMAASTLEMGLDKDGALHNERMENHLDTDKHWWPQAEAVIGFWNAWELTGQALFQRAAYECWAFIKGHLKDEECGEWHWRTDRDGKPILAEDKAGPWKAPYHNVRMCLQILDRIRNSKDPAPI